MFEIRKWVTVATPAMSGDSRVKTKSEGNGHVE